MQIRARGTWDRSSYGKQPQWNQGWVSIIKQRIKRAQMPTKRPRPKDTVAEVQRPNYCLDKPVIYNTLLWISKCQNSYKHEADRV
jgi:hypothetical protein